MEPRIAHSDSLTQRALSDVAPLTTRLGCQGGHVVRSALREQAFAKGNRYRTLLRVWIKSQV